jgi:hypothetical protein
LSSAEREQARLKVTKKSRLAHNSLLTDSGLYSTDIPPDNAAGERLLVRHRIVSGRPVRVSSLPQGIYIVKIAAGSQSFVQRIVKL